MEIIMKFSHKITAISSLLLLLTVGLLSTKQFFTVQSGMNHTINRSIADIVNGVSNTIALELANKKSMATFITSQAELNASHENITNIIRQQNAFMLIGGVTSEENKIFKSDPNWHPAASWDPRQRPWYKMAEAKNALIVTQPYIDDATNESIVSIGTPIKKNGQFSGALFFDMSLKVLSDLVNRVELFGAGYLFIVAEDSTVIAHPNKNFNGKKLQIFLPGISIKENTNQQISLKDGNTYQLNFVKIANENWYVGSLLNEKIAHQSIYNMRNDSILYSIVAVIFSVVILIFLIKNLMVPLRTLNNAIQDIASGNGDLTKRLDTNIDPEFITLATGLNTFTENLQGKVKRLKSIGEDILHGTEVTAQGASRSALSMDAQLQEVDQLATAMHEMATTSHDMAANANNAASAAQEADDATKEGSDVVAQTTGSIAALSDQIDHAVIEIRALETATNSIETVLQVINEIADQTNLLALNAAIEAARAGEQGRGFAVVADEVRTLAQRTQQSTTEISSMIEQLQTGTNNVASAMNLSKETVSDTVEKATLANQALQRISNSINRITDMNLQIATAAEEQSLVAEDINSNTIKIKDLSVQEVNSAQQTNTSMQTQSNHVAEQNKVLNTFIV